MFLLFFIIGTFGGGRKRANVLSFFQREIDDLIELTDTIRRSRRLKRRQLPPVVRDQEEDHSVVIHSHRHRHHHHPDEQPRFRHEHERYAYEDPAAVRYEKQVSFERRRERDRERDFYRG